MHKFRLTAQRLDLPMDRPFVISRGAKQIAHNVWVQLECEGIIGWGEAAPNIRYKESQQSALAFAESLGSFELHDPFDSNALPELLRFSATGNRSIKAAIEMAWWDWVGKIQNQPLRQLWDLPTAAGPQTCYTIGITAIDDLEAAITAAAEYPILKIKLGTEQDEEVIREVRRLTPKTLWVDANEGWTELSVAQKRLEFLAEYAIELVEQPMPAHCLKAMHTLRKTSPLPLFADESFTGTEKMESLGDSFHGINLKLMKTGSLQQSLNLIKQAHTFGLKVMVGCMIESSLGMTASAHLALLADYADLDGQLWLSKDPFQGFRFDKNKRVILRDAPGLGVMRTETRAPFEK